MKNRFCDNLETFLMEAQNEALLRLVKSNPEYAATVSEYSELYDKIYEEPSQKMKSDSEGSIRNIKRLLELGERREIPEKSAVYFQGMLDCLALLRYFGMM